MGNLPFAKKSLGQHWLNDELSLVSICEAANLKETDIVLEIGPGPGSLTKLLSGTVKEVIAVELDTTLANNLVKDETLRNIRVINDDILRFNFSELPINYKVVANIPYYLTSKLLRTLSETTNPPELIVLLIQKEVAERVGAKPGSMSLLSVTAQYYWQVETKDVIPAALFTPPPKVDSQIIVLSRRAIPLFDDVDPKAFFRLVKAGFAARRKTLHNSLSGGLRAEKSDVLNLLIEAKLDPGARPQTLSIDDWHRLYVQANLLKIL